MKTCFIILALCSVCVGQSQDSTRADSAVIPEKRLVTAPSNPCEDPQFNHLYNIPLRRLTYDQLDSLRSFDARCHRYRDSIRDLDGFQVIRDLGTYHATMGTIGLVGCVGLLYGLFASNQHGWTSAGTGYLIALPIGITFASWELSTGFKLRHFRFRR